MTESEWAACTDPQAMLTFLGDRRALTERKVRLFGGACCRRVWHLLVDERSRRAVVAAERYADGAATEEELLAAERAAADAAGRLAFGQCWFAAVAARMAAAQRVPVYEILARTPPLPLQLPKVADELRAQQRALVLDLSGNPFHAAALDPSWLSPTVLSLARGIYEGPAFDGVPVLADALQEAGCGSDAILDHCRWPWPHAKGCWVVDAILGKV